MMLLSHLVLITETKGWLRVLMSHPPLTNVMLNINEGVIS